MKKLTRPLTLRETYANSQKAMDYHARMAGIEATFKVPELAAKKTRKPSVPMTGAKEADVLRSVMDFLRLHPKVGWVRRMNSGGVDVGNGRVMRFGFTGCSDILGQMKDGRLLAVEVKREIGGKASEHQLAFIYTVQRNHGIAGVVRSVDDVIRLLE